MIEVIVGLPGVGKTTYLDTQIAKGMYKGWRQIATDDYIKYGFEQSLYVMIEDLLHHSTKDTVIEGVQGFRFLRKVMEEKAFASLRPSRVIMLTCPLETRIERYKARQGGKSPNTGFDKTLLKIWQEYLAYLSVDEVEKLITTVDVS